MKCSRAQELLFDFIDGLSDESLRAELDRHVGECPACEKFAAEMTRSLSLLRKVPRESLDENFNWRVRLAIHRERNAVRSGAASVGSWARAWNVRYAAGAGVAFAVVLAAGVVMQRTGSLSPPERTAMQPDTRDVATVDPGRRVTAQRPTSVNLSPLVTSEGTLVSEGIPLRGYAGGSPLVGAIDDPQRSEAVIDSLMEMQLTPLAPEERARFIQRQINRLQSRLQSQQTAPAVQP